MSNHQPTVTNVPTIATGKQDFSAGSLPTTGYMRPDKLFTVDVATAGENVLGQLNKEKVAALRNEIRQLFD
jgi:hypothetical protein